ncbi:hypothetical protein KP509_16G056800 [Ceratopteris richardii]|uniref:Protein kinase domain-containing protein n=1 Tax=Ceratopteris richardii TaxID=49495 RepID=A0A8T2SZ49_CERRI|nr:hypothetical protein KP509_16G056800 [Ceratopteris richardii]
MALLISFSQIIKGHAFTFPSFHGSSASATLLIFTVTLATTCPSSSFEINKLTSLPSVLPPPPDRQTCPSTCGSLSNISFPFGIMVSNTSTSGCNLPEFLINCSNNSNTWSPEPLSIPLVSIISITSNSITDGRVVVASSPQTKPPLDACSPGQQERLLISSSRSLPFGLTFSPFGNTILLTNCSVSLTQQLHVNETVNGFTFSSPKCLSYHSVCFNQSSEAINSGIPCFDAVSEDANITFMEEIYNCSDTIMFYELPKTDKRDLSIQMAWYISQNYYDCKTCESSNGTCTLNNITGSFQCSCPTHGNGNLTTNICGSVEKKHCGGLCKTTISIVIGIVAGIAVVVVTVVIAAFGAYFCQWRKARQIQDGGQQLSAMEDSMNKEQVKRILAHEGAFPECITKFTYIELFAATNGFAENKILGDGGFGRVYEGTLLCTGEKVAIKRLNSNNTRRFEQFLNELRILSSLDHANIVRLHGFCCESLSQLLLVYQFACNGTLADNLHGTRKTANLLWNTRMSIASETAAALAYMHQQDPPILHRDVKSTNILLGEKFHVKLADFGLSRKAHTMRSTSLVSTAPQGTPGYVDPQYEEYHRLNEKSDVYSFGVVLMELISGKVPIDMSQTNQTGHINLSRLAVAKIQAGALHELIDPVLKHHHYENMAQLHETAARVAEVAFLCLAPLQDDRPCMSWVAEALYDIAQCSINGEEFSSCNSTPKRSENAISSGT